jgi:lipoprotein NlpI
MAHHYTQASLTDPYTIMLTTVIRDFGLTRRKQLKDNLREAEESLNELKEKNVVINFYVNKVIEKSPRIKIIDAKINIQPHPEFVTEAKRANARKKIETGNTNEITAKN